MSRDVWPPPPPPRYPELLATMARDRRSGRLLAAAITLAVGSLVFGLIAVYRIAGEERARADRAEARCPLPVERVEPPGPEPAGSLPGLFLSPR